MAVSASTPWRQIGDISFEQWREELARLNSPMLPLARETYEAAKPHSGLALSTSYHEQKYATLSTIPASYHNPNSLAKPHGGKGLERWMQYPTFAAGFRAWRNRLTSPSYGNGIYARTTTLAELVHVYAPANDKNDETRYVAVLCERLNAWGVAPKGDAVLDMTPNLIPLPPIKNRVIPDSQNIAWDSLGQRAVKGNVYHRMQGTNASTDAWFRMIPGGGEAGLTDIGINEVTGEAWMWNDASGNAWPGVSPNRAGWASGKVVSPYGDGKAFVDKYGLAAVNRDQRSIEFGGHFVQPGDPTSYEEPISDAALQTAAQITAHDAHNYGIKWSEFPISPNDGFSFVRWHQEFTIGTGKVCPGRTIMEATNRIIAMTKEVMRQYQTGEMPSKSPPKPEPATIIYGRFAKPTTFTTKSGALGREYGSRTAAIKLFYPTGAKIVGAGVFYGQSLAGENRWLLDSATQARVHASGIVEPLPEVPE